MVVCVFVVPRLSGRVKVVLRIVGLVLIVVAGVSFYLSHLYQSLSSRYNATTLCLESISNLSRVSQLGRVVDVVRYYVGHYHVSMRVEVFGYNGSLLFSYGSYVPPVISVGQAMPSIITSGRVSVVRYGVCMYYGEDYVFEVEVGVLPGAVYFFVIGVALLFLGLALIAIGG